MKKILCIVFVVVYSGLIRAQPSELEVDGVFGECSPVHAARGAELRLFREPDLESEEVRIPYQPGWRVVAPKAEGLTRVLRSGALRVIKHDDTMYCEVKPEQGEQTLVPGETVQLLYYVGEGFGEIRFRGAECIADVESGLDFFELITAPEVQIWLRVFNADGTSPGWLFHDGTQTVVVDVLC